MFQTDLNKRNVLESYVFDASSSSCSYANMTRQHYHPSFQIQMQNRIFGTHNKYIKIQSLPPPTRCPTRIRQFCFKDMYCDVLVSILLFCNVQDFLSFSKTCKHFNATTRIKQKQNKNEHKTANGNDNFIVSDSAGFNIDGKNNEIINKYWHSQCQVICCDFTNKENNNSDNNSDNNFTCKCKTNWYSIYRELIVIVSKFIVSKYQFQLRKKMHESRNYSDVSVIKQFLLAKLDNINYKNYWRHLITAPHAYESKDICQNTKIECAQQVSDIALLFNYTRELLIHNVHDFGHDDFVSLFSDNNASILPLKLGLILTPISGYTSTGDVKAIFIPVIEIIKHDFVNVFKFYITNIFTSDCFSCNKMYTNSIRKLFDIPEEVDDEDVYCTLFGCACKYGSIKIVEYLFNMMDDKNYCNQVDIGIYGLDKQDDARNTNCM